MKRKPITLALALILVIGAALWGVNYRLDHPPLTKADKEFRAMVAGADRVQFWQWNCQPLAKCTTTNATYFKTLNDEQIGEIVSQMRLLDVQATPFVKDQANSLNFTFFFKHKGMRFSLNQKSRLGQITLEAGPSKPTKTYALNPRFNKRLNRALDAYLPQRIRP